jgi:hypothetical protein
LTDDPAGQIRVCAGMDGRVARSDDRDGRPAGVERRCMGRAIDADREPRHDACPDRGQVRG